MVELAYEEPEDIDDILKDLKAKSRDAMALSLIQKGVDDPIFSKIMRATNVKQAWKTLQNEYKRDVKARAINLQSLERDLKNIKIEENEVVDEFSNRIVKVVNKMKSYGKKISDRRVVVKVLINLLKMFDPIMVVIEKTKELASLSVHELMDSLKSYKKRLVKKSE